MALTDKDVDATISADWAAIQDKYAVEEVETPAPAEPETPTPATPETPAEPVRARDETGKFIPKEKAVEKAVKETPDASNSAATSGREHESHRGAVAADPAQPAERDINRAPSTWKPTARAEWEKLPPTVRTEIHRRETDFLNGQSQLLPDAKFGKSVADVVAPYRMLIEAEGGTPEAAIGDLLRTAAIFRVGTAQQKTQALGQIVQQYGVDIRALMPQQPGQPAQTSQPVTHQDPRVDQLLQQLNQERQQRAREEQTSLEGSVTRWMNEVDEKGQPKRPYLSDVMNETTALVPQMRQGNPSLSHEQVLQQAYETAIWGNPEIRALLLQAQGNGQVRVTDNQNRVREARRAASVNVTRRASLPTIGKPESLEKTIEDTARELGLIT